ncbi:competence protein CoiA family protein [Thiocystis violacea]|uniref:competence protein CoiA family protein n=1 Tax=Thiocystis violacea TaxID=13725 RepID=UPI001905C774|nr:competence protein CoiA family protein [Thiocystis violacea]
METGNLFQKFGIDKNGRVVSVQDVLRGKACECCCPVCGEMLIARQGDVRVWHFAHEGGADCEGASEGALHCAAKQIVVDRGRIAVPALEVRMRHQLADGRIGEAAAAIPSETWDLNDLCTEVSVGSLRIDVAATRDGAPLFIEIAVTHFADQHKEQSLGNLGVPCFEIALDGLHAEEWDWQTLEHQVLWCSENRHWLFHPEIQRLERDVQRMAIAKALEAAPLASHAPSQLKGRLYGCPIRLTDRGWGLCLWWAWSEQVNPILKAVAKSFGGQWRPQYKNWVIPLGSKAAIISQLKELGAEFD